MSLNKSQVTKLVVDLCWEYDRMSSSGQETLDKLCKVLNIETDADWLKMSPIQNHFKCVPFPNKSLIIAHCMCHTLYDGHVCNLPLVGDSCVDEVILGLQDLQSVLEDVQFHCRTHQVPSD